MTSSWITSVLVGTLRQAFANDTPASQAWRRMPAAVTNAMGWPTFRVIAPIVVATVERLAIDGTALQPIADPPEHFEGWRTQRDRHGYLRLAKRIGGRVCAVHIGRTWDEAKARDRISKVMGETQ